MTDDEGGHRSSTPAVGRIGAAVLSALLIGSAALVALLLPPDLAGRDEATPAGTPSNQRPTAPAPTTDVGWRYVQRANTYCRDSTDPALKNLVPLFEREPARYLRQAARLSRELVGFLRREVPVELAPRVERIVREWSAAADGFEQAAAAFAADDAERALALVAAAEEVNVRGNALATSVGLADCAQAGAIGADPTPRPTV